MQLKSLDDLFEDNLKDIFSAENQIIKAIPKFIKKCSTPSLKEALEQHLEQTRIQVDRLEQIAKVMGVKLSGKKCAGMQGLLEEGEEVLGMEGDPAVIDAAIIGAAQKVEHYEISAYGTLRAYAERLNQDEVLKLLEETLDEEESTDEKLTDIAEQEVNFDASEPAEEGAEEEFRPIDEDVEEEEMEEDLEDEEDDTRPGRSR